MKRFRSYEFRVTSLEKAFVSNFKQYYQYTDNELLMSEPRINMRT